MTIKIAVTRVSSLVGKHPYKSSTECIRELANRFKYRCVPGANRIEKKLRGTSFYNWYTRSLFVTTRMRKIGRSIITKTCKELGVIHRKPWNFFSKERGILLEPRCIDFYEQDNGTKVTSKQQRISKAFVTPMGIKFKIVGAIDGICNDKVLEIKCRSSQIKMVPEWELIQLKVYCYILKKPGVLLEYNGNMCRQTAVTLESAKETFEKLLPNLYEQIHKLECFISKKKSSGQKAVLTTTRKSEEVNDTSQGLMLKRE